MAAMTTCALWLRVSDPDVQTVENQRPALEALVQQRGWQVARVFEVGASAYKGAHLKALGELAEGARRGEYRVVVVWALDRLSREGPLPILELIHRLARYGCRVVSIQEPWTEYPSEIMDVLLAFTGWVAQQESKRRSERTKAGMARARAEGKQIGRPVGSQDGRKRRRRRMAV